MAADKGYEIVRVTVDGNRKVTCSPNPAHCYWETGPADACWVFYGAPREAVKAVIEWKDGKGGPFSGHDGKPSSSGSHVHDVVSHGNKKQKGAFFYSVKLLAADGTVVAEVDPELDNDTSPVP